MSFYILKANEQSLLQLGFEDILNKILEQPKLILSGNCMHIDKMEDIMFSSADLSQDQQDSLLGESKPTDTDLTDSQSIITLYMRFKRGLDCDNEGNLLHLDYLMEKFKREFDSQLKLSEVRKEQGFDE